MASLAMCAGDWLERATPHQVWGSESIRCWGNPIRRYGIYGMSQWALLRDRRGPHIGQQPLTVVSGDGRRGTLLCCWRWV
ncbi:MAG: hypothetical protein JWM34_3724 [Ilumatobacteraceae bacterium]|nr:hypothetical protein [Ilumatobacteraceae bacterium]